MLYHTIALHGPPLISTLDLRVISFSINMCFSDSGGGHSAPARPVELRSHVPREIRQVRTLSGLGYQAFEAGWVSNPAYGTPDDRAIEFFTIYHYPPGYDDPHILVLGACGEIGLLYGLSHLPLRLTT